MPKRKATETGKTPFSLRLHALRKARDLKMETLAQQVGVSKSFISLLESGGRQPSREVVLKFAQVFATEGTESALRDELLILAGFVPVNARAISAYRDALQSYEMALLIDPDNFKLHARLIFALIKSERYAEAQGRIQEAFQRFQAEVALLSLQAFVALSEGHYLESIRLQHQAIDGLVTDESGVRKSDLIFNLGAIYFLQGHAHLGQYVATQKQEERTLALAAFESAHLAFEQALLLNPDDVYVQDEAARLLFNRAYLLKTPEAWQMTILAYRRLMISPHKHELGPQPLMESAAFLAHAYTQNQDYAEAELTLGLLSAFNPDYWLVHYLQACLHSCRAEWDAALLALQRALAQDDSGQAEQEAMHDPDLSPLRQARPVAWKALFEERNPA